MIACVRRNSFAKRSTTPTEVGGVPVPTPGITVAYNGQPYLSQGCVPTSLYSPDAFQVPNGDVLPYYAPLAFEGIPVHIFDPYASATQSTNLAPHRNNARSGLQGEERHV